MIVGHRYRDSFFRSKSFGFFYIAGGYYEAFYISGGNSAISEIMPEKFTNVTNGITPRRWLYQCNLALSELISSVIGEKWVTDLSRLEELAPYADDPQFQLRWQEVRRKNKKLLARYVLRKLGLGINPSGSPFTSIRGAPLGPAIIRTKLLRHLKRRTKRFHRRSEERRVGKECRSRWSPYH